MQNKANGPKNNKVKKRTRTRTRKRACERPDCVFVAGIPVSVEYAPLVLMDGHSRAYGLMDTLGSRIAIDSSLGHDFLSEVLLHEIIHAMHSYGNLGYNYNDEESHTRAIACAFFSALKDERNAPVWKFIMKQGTKRGKSK